MIYHKIILDIHCYLIYKTTNIYGWMNEWMNEWVIKIKIHIKLECLRRIQSGLRKRSCSVVWWNGTGYSCTACQTAAGWTDCGWAGCCLLEIHCLFADSQEPKTVHLLHLSSTDESLPQHVRGCSARSNHDSLQNAKMVTPCLPTLRPQKYGGLWNQSGAREFVNSCEHFEIKGLSVLHFGKFEWRKITKKNKKHFYVSNNWNLTLNSQKIMLNH